VPPSVVKELHPALTSRTGICILEPPSSACGWEWVLPAGLAAQLNELTSGGRVDLHYHLLETTAISAPRCPGLRGRLGLLESSARCSHTTRQFRAQNWNECSKTSARVHSGLTRWSQKVETSRTRINT